MQVGYFIHFYRPKLKNYSLCISKSGYSSVFAQHKSNTLKLLLQKYLRSIECEYINRSHQTFLGLFVISYDIPGYLRLHTPHRTSRFSAKLVSVDIPFNDETPVNEVFRKLLHIHYTLYGRGFVIKGRRRAVKYNSEGKTVFV